MITKWTYRFTIKPHCTVIAVVRSVQQASFTTGCTSNKERLWIRIHLDEIYCSGSYVDAVRLRVNLLAVRMSIEFQHRISCGGGTDGGMHEVYWRV